MIRLYELKDGEDGSTVALSPELYTVPQVAVILALSERRVGELIAAGDLRSVRVGRSRRVTCAQILAYVQGLELANGWTRPRRFLP